GGFGEHRHRRRGHREESAMDGHDDPLTVRGPDGHDATLDELDEHGLVTGHDADLALGGLGGDESRRSGPHTLLDGNDVHAHLSHGGLLSGDLLGCSLDVVESTAAVE